MYILFQELIHLKFLIYKKLIGVTDRKDSDTKRDNFLGVRGNPAIGAGGKGPLIDDK